MLESSAKHGGFALELTAAGALGVDVHRPAEDVGRTRGQAVREALGDASGIRRYGNQTLPMAEAKVDVAVDVSKRPYLLYRGSLDHTMIGAFIGRLTEDLPYALSHNAVLALHVDRLLGKT